MQNILLVIVDCLRYDYVSPKYMPYLYHWGKQNVWFKNHWSVSHCTDPSMTCLLSGKHPDALELYSMMYEHRDYAIPDDVAMIAQTAQRRGFTTAMVSNNGRWYKRGVQYYVGSRDWPDRRATSESGNLIRSMKEPWFLTVHMVGMHTNYQGGSYAAAAKTEDGLLRSIIETVPQGTRIAIASDHGEGLGERGIVQHGFGLWDFLTHIPLLTNDRFFSCGPGDEVVVLTSHETTYNLLLDWIGDDRAHFHFGYVFQVGDTPPNIRHRGVVYPDGKQFIRGTRGDKITAYHNVPDDIHVWQDDDPESLLAKHCEKHGIDYYSEAMDSEVVERLRGLGYFD